MNFPPPEFSQPHAFPVVQNLPPRPELFMYLDITVLVLALTLATWLVLWKRSRFGIVALMSGSIAYFGFWRKGCVCAIGSIQNVAQALADPGYALTAAAAAFFLVPLVFTLFFGRVFCAAVCPHGALQDLLLVKPLKVSPWLSRGLALIPFVYLGAAVLAAVNGGLYLICRYDPFIGIFRTSGPAFMLVAGGLVLALATVVGRPYCRFLCPYGALLRLLQPLAWKRTQITPSDCVVCTLCRDACPYDSIRLPVPEPSSAERIRGRRRLALTLLATPLLMLAGAGAGYAMGPLFAQTTRDVPLARSVALAELESRSIPDPVAADAFIRSGEDTQALYDRATALERRFRHGGLVFGLWFGAVSGIFLIINSRQKFRAIYETDPSDCVACGRCFASCPREQVRIREARKE
jgi:NosR/NirI family nitrous oxide reductase transcriptional regulator